MFDLVTNENMNEFLDYIEYLEANNLTLDDYGNEVLKEEYSLRLTHKEEENE